MNTGLLDKNGTPIKVGDAIKRDYAPDGIVHQCPDGVCRIYMKSLDCCTSFDTLHIKGKDGQYKPKKGYVVGEVINESSNK